MSETADIKDAHIEVVMEGRAGGGDSGSVRSPGHSLIRINAFQDSDTYSTDGQIEDSIMFKRNAILRPLPIRAFLPIAALAIGVATASPSQAAGTVVNASLWDKGVETAMATDLGFPAAGKDMSKVTMGIALSAETVKAGEITFEVLNSSKDTIHEMIITRLRDLSRLFPYNSSESRVDEDKMPDILGEVSELDPNKTAALRLDLKPGTYLLFCNIPGHFTSGMWTIFTVK